MENFDFDKIKKDYLKKYIPKTNRWDFYKDKHIEEIYSAFVEWYIRTGENPKSREICGKKIVSRVRLFFRDTNSIELKLKDVTIEDRDAHKRMMLYMIENGIRKRNYVSTILSELNVFFCHFLQREDLRVSAIKKETRDIDPLSREEFDRIISQIELMNIPLTKKKLHLAVIKVFWNGCTRTSEGLRNIRLKDVHKNTWKLRLRSGKRDKLDPKYQSVILTKEALDAIEDYLPYRDSDDWSPDAPLFVQVHKKGRRPSAYWFSNTVKYYAACAGINKNIIPYSFRKSGGTELAMRNPKLAQIQLGHSNPKTTLDHYVIPRKKDKKRIGEILSSNKEPTPKDIARELLRTFMICDGLDEKDFLFALKSLREKEEKKNVEVDQFHSLSVSLKL